jgi:hypothetical protein
MSVCEAAMMMPERAPMSPSPEAEIISQIEALIRKLAAGIATENDLQLLHDLQKRRVDLMRPKFSQKRRVPA